MSDTPLTFEAWWAEQPWQAADNENQARQGWHARDAEIEKLRKRIYEIAEYMDSQPRHFAPPSPDLYVTVNLTAFERIAGRNDE